MTALDTIVSKFRKQSPNIALAFDEVQRRLVALEAAPPSVVIAPPVGPFIKRIGGQFGVELRNAGGGIIEKQSVYLATGYGIFNMQYYPPGSPSGQTTVVRDCFVADVAAVPPRSMDGKGEAGFWFGNKTRAARLHAENCAWMGMWTGSQCWGSVIEDVTLTNMPHIGLYVEHETRDTVFRRMSIRSVDNAVNCEWFYGGQGSYNLTFEDCDFYSENGYAAFLDAGTYGCVFRRCRFHGDVALPKNLVKPVPNVVEPSCVFDKGQVVFHSNPIGAA